MTTITLSFWLLWKRLFWSTDCAWCGRRLRRPILPLPFHHITHGICEKCLEEQSK